MQKRKENERRKKLKDEHNMKIREVITKKKQEEEIKRISFSKQKQ